MKKCQQYFGKNCGEKEEWDDLLMKRYEELRHGFPRKEEVQKKEEKEIISEYREEESF